LGSDGMQTLAAGLVIWPRRFLQLPAGRFERAALVLRSPL